MGTVTAIGWATAAADSRWGSARWWLDWVKGSDPGRWPREERGVGLPELPPARPRKPEGRVWKYPPQWDGINQSRQKAVFRGGSGGGIPLLEGNPWNQLASFVRVILHGLGPVGGPRDSADLGAISYGGP